ncbi:MAG TPA: hypothetical protein VN734_15050 [Acidobacteriaceae bacterium]|nr:hypothetical protein [Acidobacteriaceae bacterium]
MSSTPEFNGEQLAAARSERWHQNGEALLTLEAAREWVSELGLVLFAPRAQQLATPAPSLVEATLGRAVSAPTAAESEVARGLVARMTAEGTALPLNLLGSAGDVPDFVVSAQAFSYVFTLRGDKNWKQPPGASGGGNVSPLTLKVYEALVAGNAMTAGELVSELGREVTESAIVRSLVELWMQLRVIPLLQQDGATHGTATMWELTSRRFTKQIKAGANAGLPTALSAAISLYLAQVYAATEEEVETFLSPLTARSKVRDVLHGLTAARQLENAVLEGRTLVYIPGTLPEFPEVVAAEPVVAVAEIAASAGPGGGERIRKFDRPRPPRASREGQPREKRGERPFRKAGGERERPAKPFGERGRPAKPFGERKSYRRPESTTAGKSPGERERRPFQSDRASGERPKFTRPWDEERKPRPRREEGERPARPARPAGERAYRKDDTRGVGAKREFRAGPRKPGSDRGPREERPFRPRREEGERPARPAGERTYRKDDARGAGAKREFRTGPRKPGSDRGPREERPFRPRREGEREGFAARPQKPFRRREEGDRGSAEKRPFRRTESSDRPRPTDHRKPGGKPGFGGKATFGAKKKFGSGERKFSGERKPGGERKFGGERKPGGERKFSGERKAGGDRKFTGTGKAAGGSRFGGKPKPKFGSKNDRSKGGSSKGGSSRSGGSRSGKKSGPGTGTPKPRPEAEE